MINPSTIKLINCVFYAHHGVMKEEHSVGARYAVDVEMQVDFEYAAIHDDLSATVDYEQVYQILKDVITTQKAYLIEKLARQISETLLTTLPKINAVTVRVRKMNPPVGGVCDFAEAEYNLNREKEKIFIGIGSNIGERLANINYGLHRINSNTNCKVLKSSNVYETRPLGMAPQPNYLNMVIEMETSLTPEQLLTFLKTIEKDGGRLSGQPKWSSRTLDLDILLFGNRVIKSELLVIPHVELGNRSFVLVPLLEINGSLIHPETKKPLSGYLANLPDNLQIHRYAHSEI